MNIKNGNRQQGTTGGAKVLSRNPILRFIRRNKLLVLVAAVYALLFLISPQKAVDAFQSSL